MMEKHFKNQPSSLRENYRRSGYSYGKGRMKGVFLSVSVVEM
jgi:hypothetical protein